MYRRLFILYLSLEVLLKMITLILQLYLLPVVLATHPIDVLRISFTCSKLTKHQFEDFSGYLGSASAVPDPS
jgi:hypothetical protein